MSVSGLGLWGSSLVSSHCYPSQSIRCTRPRPEFLVSHRRCLQAIRCSKTSGGGKRKPDGKKQQQNPLRTRMQQNAILSRLLDGALIMGDAVMVTATELSSQRIPWDQDTKWLLGVAVLSWFAGAVAVGDYRGRPPTSDSLYVQLVLGPVFIAVLDTTVTWAAAAVLAIIAYSILVNQLVIDPAALMDGLGTDDLSPQLEIAVASLIIMPCWRGIVAKLRSS